MALLYQLEIQGIYNFTMRAGAILGYTFKNATVKGILDFDSANVIEDVTPIHASVYSELPSGTPKNARDLVYVKVVTSTGETRVWALNWIASQPELVTSSTLQVIISNAVISDIERLRQVLKTNGWNQIEISVLNEPPSN